MKMALLIIDVQYGMFTMTPPVYKGGELLKNIKCAKAFARARHMTIIYLQHNGPMNSPLEKGSKGWDIHKEISPEKGDIIIHKDTPDGFFETTLHQKLNELHIKHLFITGIQTEACVDTICRRGFSLDYKVTLLTDAHSTFDKTDISAKQIISHHNEVLRWFGDTVRTEEWIGGE
jgi:nicotinamidase-related amidase